MPFGTCKLVVCDTAIVQSIYGAIQEYGGFERPGWLDLTSGNGGSLPSALGPDRA